MRVNIAISLLLLVCVTLCHRVAAQKDQPFSDYDEPLPNDDAKDGKNGEGKDGAPSGDDPNKPLAPEELEEDKAKTKFTDDRFAKLFPSRSAGRNGFMAKDVAKPKPTLPSFIKGTPPTVKIVATTPSPRARARAAITQGTTRRGTGASTTTPRPGANLRGRLNASTARPLSGRLATSTSRPALSTTSSPSAAAIAAARRRQQSSNSPNRFQSRGNNSLGNSNSTIPALNPRRN